MSKLNLFTFESFSVRVFNIKGQPWFVAADIATVLQYRNAPDLVRILDEDERGTQIVRTPSGNQEMIIINESGLYSSILRSRKPEAKRFKKWVTDEVLPAIRKTGRYEAQPPSRVSNYPSFRNRRFFIDVDEQGNEHIKEIERGVFLAAWNRLPKVIRDPGAQVEAYLLIEIIHACADELERRRTLKS